MRAISRFTQFSEQWSTTEKLRHLEVGGQSVRGATQVVVEELAKTCRGKGRNELIWSSRSGDFLGPPSSHDSWLSGAVERCQQAADKVRAEEAKNAGESSTLAFPRITAHALRHTAASLAISAGANVKVVQRMLGHASAAMTLDVYADLFDDDLTAVADKFDESVGKMWARRAPSGA